jgi:hypothetical protein
MMQASYSVELAEKFPNLGKEMGIRVHIRTPIRRGKKRSSSWHIIV